MTPLLITVFLEFQYKTFDNLDTFIDHKDHYCKENDVDRNNHHDPKLSGVYWIPSSPPISCLPIHTEFLSLS